MLRGYVRPESLPTIIFEGEPVLDDTPYETPQGRLIPGSAYAKEELQMLLELSENQAKGGPILPTVQQLGRITLNPAMGCWELPTYQDAKNRARYGQLGITGLHNPSNLAHRTLYMVFYGADSLPEGRYSVLDHLCENKPCCYPRHLELVTYSANTHRGRSTIGFGQLALEY